MIHVCAFSGGSALPLEVAQEYGLFARQGLDVRISFTRSSDELMTGLLDGRFDIVHAAPDNFLAWRDRTGKDIVAWLGGSSGPISLVARPEISTILALRGARIAVDSPTSGWAPILVRLLAGAGLGRNDCELVPTGATRLVFNALVENRCAAAMLNLPWSVLALRSGCRVLADHRSVAPRLQTSCAASLAAWLAAHANEADAYLRSMLVALTWLYDPTRLDDATALLARSLEVAVEDAALVFNELCDPLSGWPPSAFIDPAGMRAVCALRADALAKLREAPEAYSTLEVYRRVLGF